MARLVLPICWPPGQDLAGGVYCTNKQKVDFGTYIVQPIKKRFFSIFENYQKLRPQKFSHQIASHWDWNATNRDQTSTNRDQAAKNEDSRDQTAINWDGTTANRYLAVIK